RFFSSTSGVLFGFEEQLSRPGSSDGYTGIAYNNIGSGWGWNTVINFAQACNANPAGESMQVWFWDTDHRNNTGDPNAGVSPPIYWQNNTQPMRYEIWAYNRANDAVIGSAPVVQGILDGGQNTTD